MTKDILFNNANILYDLRYDVVFDDTLQEAPKQLTFNGKPMAESPHISPGPIPMPSGGSPSRPTTAGPIDPRSGTPYQPPSFPPPPTAPKVYDQQVFDNFMQQNPEVKFVYVQWLDYMATVRARIVPIKEFTRIIRESERIGISQGNTGTLQNDGLTPAVNTTGQIYVEPDLRSLRRTHNKDPLPSATVLSYWRTEDGQPLPSCPRNNLETLINQLQYTYQTTLLVGFEIEVTFLSRNNLRNAGTDRPQELFSPLTKTHAWGTLTPEQWLQMPFLTEIILALDQMGIEIQQFHAESGQGQYEFVLPPQPPLLAVDTLIQTRQVIAQIAALHDLRATLHPKPFEGIGNAAHAHISLHPPDRDMQFFVGGILQHLPAVCAFMMPEGVSYSRVADDHWTSGTWVAWGTQNREVPLRRINSGRWEIRCLDGMANIYLALSAIVAAGLLGLHSGDQVYPQLDLPYNPASLHDEERAQYGVTQRLPASFEEALDALKRDGQLGEALDQNMVRDYIVMKESEQRMLADMGDAERRVFLIERY